MLLHPEVTLEVIFIVFFVLCLALSLLSFLSSLFFQIKLQESPEDMPAGQTPYTVVLFAHNDLVDKVQPGDRVNVTGTNISCVIAISPFYANATVFTEAQFEVLWGFGCFFCLFLFRFFGGHSWLG